MRQNWQYLLDFTRFVATRFSQDRCTQVASSLTFTTLLSLVPLITIGLTMFAAFPVFDEFSTQIKVYLLNNLMPDAAGKIITDYMQQFAESATRLTAVGIVFLGVTAMSLMLTIDAAFNMIWRATHARPLIKRLLVYWAVLTLAPLLIGISLSLTSWLVGASMGYIGRVPFLGASVLTVLPVLITTIAFAMLFRLVPNRYVPLRHALIGAFVGAVVFEIMNRIFGYYISHFPTYKLVYGAFAAFPIFLLWIYLSWLAILLGALIAASLSYWRTSTNQQLPPATQLLDALRTLQIMTECFRQGKIATFSDISSKLQLGYDALEKILDKLANANMVRKSEGQGWLLMRDVGTIRAAELLHLFFLNGAGLSAAQESGPVNQWFISCVEQIEKSTDLTLQELFERSAS